MLGYLDPIAGPLSLVAGMFDIGKASQYAPKRQAAAGTAKAGLTQLGSQISGAKSLADLQKALEMEGTPAPLLEVPRADLPLLGLAPEGLAYGGPQGQANVSFSSLTPEQFGKLLDVVRTDPDRAMSWVAASGDVPYLPYEQAVAVQQAARTQVFETLKQAAAPPVRPVSLRQFLAAQTPGPAAGPAPGSTLIPAAPQENWMFSAGAG